MTTTRRPRSAILGTAALAVGIVCATPFAYLITQAASRFGDLGAILTEEDVLGLLGRSLGFAATVSIGAGILGTATGWLIGRTDLPARRFWGVALALPLVIPSFVGAFTLIAALAPGGLLDEYVLGPLGIERGRGRIEGFLPAVIVLTILTTPLVLLPVLGALRALPASIEESARSLGRRPAAAFRTIVLPQLRLPITAGMLLVFLYSLSEFGAVQLLRYDTLTRAIYSSRLDQSIATSLGLVLAVTAICAVAIDRVVARRIPAARPVGGRTAAPVRLGFWRIPALLLVGSNTLVGVIIPVAVLLQWSIRGIRNGSAGSFTEIPSLAAGSASLAVIGGFVTVVAVLPVAYATVRRRTSTGEIAGVLVTAGFALPGLVVALALTYFSLRAPVIDALYGTTSLLVVAYLVHFGSQGLRAASIAVESVPARLTDAARSLGASRTRRFLTVELPIMRSGLAAAFGLVLLSVLKELPATLLLRPPGTDTLATRIFDASQSGLYARAGVFSLTLLILSAGLTFALTIRPMSRGT